MVSLFPSSSYILSQSLFSQVPGSSSERTGLGLNRSPAGDSLQHLNSMNPTLVNIHDRKTVLFQDKTWETNTSPQISNTHTNSNIGNDINGHVINMYTHTKGKKPCGFLTLSVCVYLATAQGYVLSLCTTSSANGDDSHVEDRGSTSFTGNCQK